MISSEGLQAVLSLEAWGGLFQGEEYHPRVLYLTPGSSSGYYPLTNPGEKKL